MRFIVVLALAAACGGCASVTRGMTDQVQIVTNPASSDVRTSMGQACTSPCTLQFNRKDEFTVIASKPGYHSAEMAVTTRVAGGGVAGFAGNVLLGGVVGMAVDVTLTLVPLRRGEAPRTLKQEPPLPEPLPPPAADAQGAPQS